MSLLLRVVKVVVSGDGRGPLLTELTPDVGVGSGGERLPRDGRSRRVHRRGGRVPGSPSRGSDDGGSNGSLDDPDRRDVHSLDGGDLLSGLNVLVVESSSLERPLVLGGSEGVGHLDESSSNDRVVGGGVESVDPSGPLDDGDGEVERHGRESEKLEVVDLSDGDSSDVGPRRKKGEEGGQFRVSTRRVENEGKETYQDRFVYVLSSNHLLAQANPKVKTLFAISSPVAPSPQFLNPSLNCLPSSPPPS